MPEPLSIVKIEILKLSRYVSLLAAFLLFVSTTFFSAQVFADDHGNYFGTATAVSIGTITNGDMEAAAVARLARAVYRVRLSDETTHQ